MGNLESVSIRYILQLLKKNLILFLVIALCGGLLGFFWTNFAVAPKYTASASLYVGSDQEGNTTSSELNYSKSLVDTYLTILQSKTISETVVTNLKSKYPNLTVAQIENMFSGSAINDTEAFRISITSTDLMMAVDVCNAMAEIAPNELTRITKAGSVEIIDKAASQYVAKSHPVMKNTMISAGGAFLVAFFIIFLVKVLDNKIYDREDLAETFKLPILGVIPDNNVTGGKREKREVNQTHSPIEDDRKRLLNENTSFYVTEAYRMARTNLTYLPIGDGCKRIAFTSAFAGEGKTTTCCNVAIALAQNGEKVLLIDADMRKPRVDKLFRIKSKYGLSECIAGICKDIPIQQSSYSNLFVMTAGNPTDNAADLLSSPRLETILKSCEDKFDYIIFDMPPLNLVTDAAIITKLVAGYIMVSFSGYSSMDGVKDALDSLEQVGGKLLGFVLAGVTAQTGKGYGKYSRYGYYGAEGREEKDGKTGKAEPKKGNPLRDFFKKF